MNLYIYGAFFGCGKSNSAFLGNLLVMMTSSFILWMECVVEKIESLSCSWGNCFSKTFFSDEARVVMYSWKLWKFVDSFSKR